MATSDILGFAQRVDKGSPKFTTPVPLGGGFPSSQIRFSDTARLLASSDSGSNGYFPGQNVVVADFDNPFIEFSFLNLPPIASGELRFKYVAPNVQDGDLSIEIFDAQGTRIGGQSLPATSGTYEILPLDIDPNARVSFTGTPSSIRIGGVLREFAIDNLRLESFTTPPSNLPPDTNPSSITVAPGSTTQLTELGGSDPDGTIAQFVITSLPAAGQGTIFFGNFAADGTPVTLGQLISSGQISNLFFQASSNFSVASFTYAAIDNQNIPDPSPATVTINAITPQSGAPVAVNDTISPTRSINLTGNDDNFDALTYPIEINFSNVLSNDTVNGATITGVQPSGTDLIDIATNQFVFTPGRGFPPSSFLYTLTNSSGLSTASVTIQTITYTVNGLDGNDSLAGAPENDTLSGNIGNDVVAGRGGSDRLLGGQGNDSLVGGVGNDTLIGGIGNDTLTGSNGADSFQYFFPNQGSDGTINSLGSGTISSDVITDFSSNQGDRILISATGFNDVGRTLRPGIPLTRAQFLAGSGVSSPANGTNRFIYDTSSGNLYYDDDGDSSGITYLIANVQGLTISDIIVF